MNLENYPLVSIVVITYNSSKYVLETLESAKAQTYKNLELIVSDDASQDNTVELCRKWIDANGNRFVRTEIVTTPHNTGIPSNCNRGYRAARGEWFKGIAGDDILLDDCVERNMEYVKRNPETRVLFSKVQGFIDENGKRRLIDIIPVGDNSKFALMTAEQQLVVMLTDNRVAAPSCFMQRSLYQEYPYEETYPLMEDYNHWLHLNIAGIKLNIMDEVTVMYRNSLGSVSNARNLFYSKSFRRTMSLFFYLEKLDMLEKYAPQFVDRERKHLLMVELSDLLFHNKKNWFTRLCFRLLSKVINLFHYQ
jgi:alpha-1,3-rhamnosyltransferase